MRLFNPAYPSKCPPYGKKHTHTYAPGNIGFNVPFIFKSFFPPVLFLLLSDNGAALTPAALCAEPFSAFPR